MNRDIEPTMNHPEELPTGRRERKARAARRALLDAGLSAFQRQPISLVSVLDITEIADMAKGAFYLHFRSKDDFLIHLWCELRDQLIAVLRHRIDGVRFLNARIQAIAHGFHDFASNRPEAVVFWLRLSSHLPDEVGEPNQLLHAREAYLQALAGFIFSGASSDDALPAAASPAQRSLHTPQQIQLAAMIDAIVWGLIHQELRFGRSLPDKGIYTRIITAAHRVLRTTGENES